MEGMSGWASVGLWPGRERDESWARFSPKQRREYFFVSNSFLVSKTCKLSCSLKYLEKSTFLKFTKHPWPSYISIEVPCILFWKL
jgi:hypothetical protein